MLLEPTISQSFSFDVTLSYTDFISPCDFTKNGFYLKANFGVFIKQTAFFKNANGKPNDIGPVTMKVFESC